MITAASTSWGPKNEADEINVPVAWKTVGELTTTVDNEGYIKRRQREEMQIGSSWSAASRRMNAAGLHQPLHMINNNYCVIPYPGDRFKPPQIDFDSTWLPSCLQVHGWSSDKPGRLLDYWSLCMPGTLSTPRCIRHTTGSYSVSLHKLKKPRVLMIRWPWLNADQSVINLIG